MSAAASDATYTPREDYIPARTAAEIHHDHDVAQFNQQLKARAAKRRENGEV